MGKKVLVVDNDQLVLEFMRDILFSAGHEVMTALDGLTALDMLDRYAPDVIFTDLVMPKIDGKQLCRIIRQLPKLNNTFLVVLSGLVTEEKVDPSQLAADAVIPKGSFDEISDHVLQIVNNSKLAPGHNAIGSRSTRPRDITEELFSAKRHLEIILERMTEGVLEFTADGRIVYANPAAVSLMDIKEQSILGASFASLFPKSEVKRIQEMLKNDSREKKIVSYENPLVLGNRYIVISMIPSVDGGSSKVAIVNDITELKRAEFDLKQRNRELKLLNDATRAFNSTLDLDQVIGSVLEEVRRMMDITGSTIWLTDPEPGELYCQHATGPHSEQLCGWRLKIGEGLAGLVAKTGDSVIVGDTREDNRHFKKTDNATGMETRSMVTVPLKARQNIVGVLQLVDCQAKRFNDSQLTLLEPLAASAAVAIENARLYEKAQQEIEERKRAERQILFDAFHDRLTGLPNQALFLDRLDQAIKRSIRRPDYSFCVILLGLDRFNEYKTSFGHQASDRILHQMAKELKEYMRNADTVARLGGDQFAILMQDVSSARDAVHIARRIQEEVVMRLKPSGQDVSISASIGIVQWRNRSAMSQDILRDAETALYTAKRTGKGCCLVFDETMHAEAVARLEMESALERAFRKEEFKVYYQPYVSLKTGRIVGMEALVRWLHPETGLIPPDEFIPVAEQTGIINSIGLWVMREACRQMRLWQDRFPSDPKLSISVNLSGRQLSQKSLVTSIERILTETRLDPPTLKLEITESVIMEEARSTVEFLTQLKKLNIQLLIDDFGTGYSSLSYLHSFPVDALKVDKSFVGKMSVESRNLEIVRTVITLAHTLGLGVYAEGIENATQLGQLRALQCEFGQGYLFAKPLPAEDMEKLLVANPSW